MILSSPRRRWSAAAPSAQCRYAGWTSASWCLSSNIGRSSGLSCSSYSLDGGPVSDAWWNCETTMTGGRTRCAERRSACWSSKTSRTSASWCACTSVLKDMQCDAGPTAGGALARTGRTFDLLVLDLMLPGLDGVSLCRRRPGGRPNRDVPILMLTARGEDRTRWSASRAAPTTISPSRLAFASSWRGRRVAAPPRRGPLDRTAPMQPPNCLPIPASRSSWRVGGFARGQPRLELTHQEFSLLHLLAPTRASSSAARPC